MTAITKHKKIKTQTAYVLSAKTPPTGTGFASKPKTNRPKKGQKTGFMSGILRMLKSGLFLYTRTRIYTLVILLAISSLTIPTALAESSASSSYRLDYSRFTSDSDRKTSLSYTLLDSISDIQVEGASSSYNLRNVYAAGLVSGPVCGNGIIETGEQCEGSNFQGLTCSNFGFNSGTLQCGNCQIVTTSCFNSSGGGGGGHICGNGIREASEQCDDGNGFSGDGCSAYCFIEEHVCGNGIKEIGEQCDDANTNYGDGCTPMCTLEIPGELPPEEPEPEPQPTPVEEPELIFEPGFDPGAIFVFEQAPPRPEPEIEPPLRPAAPAEPTGIVRSAHDYHFENYTENQLIKVIDETPFVVTTAEPNAMYEMVIFDRNMKIITRQGVQSTPEGVALFESIPFLEYDTYGIALFDKDRELFKSWTITIEDRAYRLHDNLMVNGELNREYLALGSFPKLENISGKGKPNTKYHAYLQRITKHSKKVSEIQYLQAMADKQGNYRIELPKNLRNGAYQMHVVQVYQDSKVSRNKRYIFDINNTEKQRNLWILLAIFVIFVAGQSLKSGRRGKFKVRSILSIAVALSMFASYGSALAVDTTPGVFVYEGKLLNAAGTPITTAQTFRFSFWSSDDFVAGDLTGAGAIDITAPAYGGWFEEHTLTPNTDGTFFVELGSITALPDMLVGTHDHLMVEIKSSGAPDTSYELMDPTGDGGVDADDRQTIGSTPFTNNADFIDNAELGTTAGDIVALGVGDVWDITFIPDATNADSWTIDDDDSVGAGGHIELVFGDTIAESLSWDVTNSWFEFSDDVSFNQNEIKDVAIDNLAAAPGAPVAGQIYHNTTDGNTYIWNGAVWEDITAGAGAANDLDDTYDNDADKQLDVDNAAGLEFESTVAADIIVDLQSTGDFVLQDAGTPFAIFTDGGSFGIGNTSPISVFHVDSNAANTAAIATLENTAGDIQFFRTDTTPEGAVTGSIGDLAIDGTNGNAYIKQSGNATSTGWLQFGGEEGKTAIFHAEYEDATIEGDGSANRGLLASHFADEGGTDKYNYYEWTTRQTTLQDIDVVISFRLPEDFQSFTSTPLSILYETSNAVTTDNRIDVSMFDTTGTAVALAGGSTLAAADWTTASITFGGLPTFTAGDVVTLVIKLSSLDTGFARVSDVIFNYNGT